MTENHIELDLWGGHQKFETNKLIYHINRPCGLFSNITVAMYGICKIKSLGFDVKTIDFYLQDYERHYNFYDDLFIKKDLPSGGLISLEEAILFMDTVHPTKYGLSRGRNDFYKQDLEKVMPIAKKIYNHYFSVNKKIVRTIRNIEKEILYRDAVFIWARKTDKTVESDVPSVNRYLKEVNSCTNIKHIYIQTDDFEVAEEFQLIDDARITVLGILPISNANSHGFHVNLSHVSGEQFFNDYKMSKIEYLRNLLAMVHIAAKCKYYIGYPGNLTTVIPCIKNSFKNCILFLNAQELIR